LVVQAGDELRNEYVQEVASKNKLFSCRRCMKAQIV